MLFDPTRLPPRNEVGWTSHPDIPEAGEEEPMTPYFAELGYHLGSVLADDEATGDPALQARFDQYLDNSESSIAWWTPKPPDTLHMWLLVSIHDTESGPCAWWVRPLEPEFIERNRALRELDLAWARANAPTTFFDAGGKPPLLMALHKARYECEHIHAALRLLSGEWLRANGCKRTGGRQLLPPGQLPKGFD